MKRERYTSKLNATSAYNGVSSTKPLMYSQKGNYQHSVHRTPSQATMTYKDYIYANYKLVEIQKCYEV